MAGESRAAEAEAQLHLELRRDLNRLLEEQERLVACFALRWLRPDATEVSGQAASTSAHASLEVMGSTPDTAATPEILEVGPKTPTASALPESGWQIAEAPERLGGAVPPLLERSASKLSDGTPQGDVLHSESGYLTRISESFRLESFDLSSEDTQRLSSVNPLMRPFWRLHFFLSRVREPKRTGLLASIVQSKQFEILTLIAIALNGVFVVFETELDARQARADPTGQEEGQTDSAFIIDQMFTAYFVTEILLRLLLHRLYFFCNDDWFWNIFDFTIVVSSMVEVLVTVVGGASEAMDATLLRILRVFRMFKSLRLVRTLHFVRPLRQLVECMAASLTVVFWCMVLLLFITGIFATFLVQCVTAFLLDGGPMELAGTPEGSEDLAVLTGAFGSINSAMWALFKATSGGEDWAVYYDLVKHAGALAALVYVSYIVLFFLAAWNMVSSLFLEQVLALAASDMEQQLLAKRRQDCAHAMDIRSLVETFDHNFSGTISVADFKRSLLKPRVRHFFELRNINVKDAEAFFAMLELSAGSNEVGLDIVVSGLMKMRGFATNMDLQALHYQLHEDRTNVNQNFKSLGEQLQGVAAELQRASAREVLGKSLQRPSGSIAMVERDIEELAVFPAGLESARALLFGQKFGGSAAQAAARDPPIEPEAESARPAPAPPAETAPLAEAGGQTPDATTGQ